MRIKNALLSNIIILLLAGTTEFDLYASDLATNSIVVYAVDGTKTTFATGLNSPQGIFPPKADFNGDGKSDILWQNSVTGERVIWLMNGTSVSSSVSLGVVGTSWNIVGSEDFNADGMPDIHGQNNCGSCAANAVTGERVIWLMNGTSLSSSVSLGIVGT